jgi:outer membrane protein assembly factor BamD (BamD/ComL family)
MKHSPFIRIVLLIVLAPGVTAGAQQSNNEEFARRQYESGLAFMNNAQYAEGLKDLQAVVETFAATSVADNALLRIAQYQLDTLHDFDTAKATTDRLLKQFAESDSAPMAYVITGRLALARGRSAAEINAALASFERVSRLYPGSDAVPAAGYYSGEALRVSRRLAEALDRYRRVAMEYPRSQWAARASLAAGFCLVQSDRALSALQDIQWVRSQFPDSPVANDALGLNTIIYRLYMKAPAQPAYVFTNRTIGGGDYRDVMGVAIDSTGRVLLGHKGGVSMFDARGAQIGSTNALEASAFFIDEANRVIVAKAGSLVGDRVETLYLSGPNKPIEDVGSIVATGGGDRLVIDAKTNSILRFAANGRYVGPFGSGPATRLAVNAVDDVAILDRNGKAVTVVDREGRPLARLQAKGGGFELQEPVDVAFDALGHLYVLDRGRGSVLVFGPKQRLLTTLTIPQNGPGAFTRAVAFGVDPAGRLMVYDERVKRIQVYQ